MKKQRIFKLIDIIIYFNVLVFFLGGFPAIKDSTPIGISFFVIGSLNFIFILLTIKLRIDFNKNLDEKIQKELEAEEMMGEVTKSIFNKSKQVFLESRIEAEIKDKMPTARIIRNAYIPKSDGNDSEIDLIVISEQGIFVIEAKNITGKIFGTWKQDKMIVQHPGGKSFDIINPINQNTMHFMHLKNILGLKNDIFRSIVVFGDLGIVESFKDVPYYTQVCQIRNLMFSMNKLAKRFGTRLEKYEIENIYKNLIEFTQKTDEREQNHINRIQNDKINSV
ncbi:MAG: NERD domain-containing protein [Acholeplasmataceae bacterium]|nr:NERD domain-containing protein [Acholeplasmataceae bacterium]